MRIRSVLLAAVALVSVNALAAESIRLECESTHMADVYVSAKGSIRIEGSNGNNATGSLRISLGSSSRSSRVSVYGQYIDTGRSRFLILRQNGGGYGIDEIYAVLGNGGLFKDSYIQMRDGGFYKMACRAQ